MTMNDFLAVVLTVNLGVNIFLTAVLIRRAYLTRGQVARLKKAADNLTQQAAPSSVPVMGLDEFFAALRAMPDVECGCETCSQQRAANQQQANRN